jgi:hypothetical protein
MYNLNGLIINKVRNLDWENILLVCSRHKVEIVLKSIKSLLMNFNYCLINILLVRLIL